MGYRMNKVGGDFHIRYENQLDALKKLKEEFNEENISAYSSYAGRNIDNIKDMLISCRWEPSFDEDGNIDNIHFIGENIGDDLEFFNILAPYVENGSYIDMSGEEGELWRWLFEDGKCTQLEPSISFDNDIPQETLDATFDGGYNSGLYRAIKKMKEGLEHDLSLKEIIKELEEELNEGSRA